jgi:hypothetical protein
MSANTATATRGRKPSAYTTTARATPAVNSTHPSTVPAATPNRIHALTGDAHEYVAGSLRPHPHECARDAAPYEGQHEAEDQPDGESWQRSLQQAGATNADVADNTELGVEARRGRPHDGSQHQAGERE